MSKAIIKEVKDERASVGCICPAGRIVLDLQAYSSILTMLPEKWVDVSTGRELLA